MRVNGTDWVIGNKVRVRERVRVKEIVKLKGIQGELVRLKGSKGGKERVTVRVRVNESPISASLTTLPGSSVLQKGHASFRITFRPPGAKDRGRNRCNGILNRAYL